MKELYSGIDKSEISSFDELIVKMTFTQYRLMYVFAISQFVVEIALFLMYFFTNTIENGTLDYIIFYILLPLIINLLIISVCHILLVRESRVYRGPFIVSFGLLFLCSSLYFMHHTFNVVIMLFFVPVMLSCVYGNKKLSISLGIVGILLKWILDPTMYSGVLVHYRETELVGFFAIMINSLLFAIIMAVIILFCIKIIDVENKKRLLAATLEHEKEAIETDYRLETYYRKSLSKNKIIDYVANASDDSFVEGEEAFTKIFGNKIPGYRECMIKLITLVVHPEDMSVFSNFFEPGYFEYMSMHSPKYSRRVRVSKEKTLQYINVSEDYQILLQQKDKEWFFVSFNATIVSDPVDNVTHIYVDILDIDDEVKKEKQLLEEISNDPLTGVLNRKAGEQMIRYSMQLIEEGALFMLDLDGFKDVNDNLGHPEGDRILTETASLIKETFRSNDYVCRLGGDEFMVYAPGMEEKMAEEKAMELLSSLYKKIPTPSEKEIILSTSIGIALYPKDGEAYEILYSNADMAMYEAKSQGKGTYAFFKN